MALVVLGMNHRTAPLELRERTAFAPGEIAGALEWVRREGPVDEAVLLSTCNRTELYAAGRDGEAALERGRALLREWKEVDASADVAYRLRDRECVEHLLRVASGIDSMVIGEQAILGQVKEAVERARAADAVGPALGRLFSAALRTGKRARSETEIGRGAVSLEKSAVQLAEKVFGELGRCAVLVVGAGDSGERVAALLREAGAREVAFANRTAERARELAERHGGRPVGLDALAREISAADVVIAAVSATERVIDRTVLDAALDGRRRGPLLLLDLGVPRNVDPEAGRFESVFLYAVDDLRELVDRNLGRRRGEIPAVEAIVAEEAERFLEWIRSLETTPVLVAMREEAERIRRQALERFGRGLPPEQRELLERFSAGLVNKLLHRPTVSLRRCDPQTPEGLRRLDWTRTLFGIEPGPSANGEAGERPAREKAR